MPHNVYNGGMIVLICLQYVCLSTLMLSDKNFFLSWKDMRKKRSLGETVEFALLTLTNLSPTVPKCFFFYSSESFRYFWTCSSLSCFDDDSQRLGCVVSDRWSQLFCIHSCILNHHFWYNIVLSRNFYDK